MSKVAIVGMMILLCYGVYAMVISKQPRPVNAAHSLLASGGKGGWVNVKENPTIETMEGRVVLLDFWTYGCINCIHVIPDLAYLEKTFGDKLLVIGVHSAKFEAERGSARILSAAQRFGLKHPVINDSDFEIWKQFGVRAWPTLILLDRQGNEVSRYAGEGKRDAIEADIREYLSLQGEEVAVQTHVDVADEVASSTLSFPARIILDHDLLYIADTGHHRVMVADTSGTINSIIGSGKKGFSDGSYETAMFNGPRGLAIVNGQLYIADTDNHALRRVNLSTQEVMTVAGIGERGYRRDIQSAPGRNVAIASPWDLTLLEDGKTLAIAMAGTHQLWQFDTEKETLGVLAGSGRENIDDGRALAATLAQPSGLSRVGGVLFFVDAESSSLRVLEGGYVKTLIGTGLFDYGLVDGAYPEAMLQHAQGVWADDERVFVADTYNNVIRIYDRKTQLLSTLEVEGDPLNEPGDIVIRDNQAWVADTNNHAVRVINLNTGNSRVIHLHE